MTNTAYTIETQIHPLYNMLANPTPADREAHTVYLVWEEDRDAWVPEFCGEFYTLEAAQEFIAKQEARA